MSKRAFDKIAEGLREVTAIVRGEAAGEPAEKPVPVPRLARSLLGARTPPGCSIGHP
jgi:hypothetical protein